MHNFFQAFCTRTQSSLQNSRNIPSPVTSQRTPFLLSPHSVLRKLLRARTTTQKIGKINFFSLSLSKRIFDQRKKGKGEESNDDATGARLGQNRKGLIYPCGGIALRGNRHVFTRVIPNRDRITAFRRASNLIATRALAASPKIHYMYPCSACSCPLEREGRNAAKGEEEEGKKNREREKKKEKRGGRREDENEGEKHSRIMPRCEMHGSPRIITSARPPRQES